jgi:hypothetical protein
MTEKDVVMKDESKAAKTEEVKASEPADPFFGTLFSITYIQNSKRIWFSLRKLLRTKIIDWQVH